MTLGIFRSFRDRRQMRIQTKPPTKNHVGGFSPPQLFARLGPGEGQAVGRRRRASRPSVATASTDSDPGSGTSVSGRIWNPWMAERLVPSDETDDCADRV